MPEATATSAVLFSKTGLSPRKTRCCSARNKSRVCPVQLASRSPPVDRLHYLLIFQHAMGQRNRNIMTKYQTFGRLRQQTKKSSRRQQKRRARTKQVGSYYIEKRDAGSKKIKMKIITIRYPINRVDKICKCAAPALNAARMQRVWKEVFSFSSLCKKAKKWLRVF